MQETLNFTDTIVDDDGKRYDLGSNVYNPGKFEVNELIRASVGRQLVRGAFQDF